MKLRKANWLILVLVLWSGVVFAGEARPKLYFAHPLNVYDTALEKSMAIALKRFFPGWDIENPNQPQHQKGYTERGGMKYFYEKVLPQCGACVAMPFLDGKMGAGVAGEAKWCLENKRTVGFLDPIGITDLTLFSLRKFTDEEAGMLNRRDSRLVLSREETRLRTWIFYNRIKRPYGEAHLAKMPIPKGFYPDKR